MSFSQVYGLFHQACMRLLKNKGLCFKPEFAPSIWTKTQSCSWILAMFSHPYAFLLFSHSQRKQEKFAAFFVPSWLHFKCVANSLYVLQTWVLQITGKHLNKTDAAIREVQDMSHLPPCPHTSVPLFLLCNFRVVGCPANAGMVSCPWAWMNAVWAEAQVGTAFCSPGTVLMQIGW